eukprot:11195156-Lingulodinium_polyedra.AAC.1
MRPSLSKNMFKPSWEHNDSLCAAQRQTSMNPGPLAIGRAGLLQDVLPVCRPAAMFCARRVPHG